LCGGAGATWAVEGEVVVLGRGRGRRGESIGLYVVIASGERLELARVSRLDW